MNRVHDTPRTDAVLNTFDGKASKLAADLATHAEELERECDALKKAIRSALLELCPRARPSMCRRILRAAMGEDPDQIYNSEPIPWENAQDQRPLAGKETNE